MSVIEFKGKPGAVKKAETLEDWYNMFDADKFGALVAGVVSEDGTVMVLTTDASATVAVGAIEVVKHYLLSDHEVYDD